MKKRYKSILLILTGAVIYGIGITCGISFLGSDKSSILEQQEVAANKAEVLGVTDSQALSKWIAEVKPAAGPSSMQE